MHLRAQINLGATLVSHELYPMQHFMYVFGITSSYNELRVVFNLEILHRTHKRKYRYLAIKINIMMS